MEPSKNVTHHTLSYPSAATPGQELPPKITEVQHTALKRIREQDEKRRSKRDRVPLQDITQQIKRMHIGKPANQPMEEVQPPSTALTAAQPSREAQLPSGVPAAAQPIAVVESISEQFAKLWKEDPEKAKNFAHHHMYYNNDQVPFFLGKAITLKQHYDARIERRRQIALQNPYNASGREKTLDNTPNPAVFYGTLSAVRSIEVGQCYCKEHACKTKPNCETLTRVFGIPETRIKAITNQILKATYNTSDPLAIQAIRARSRSRQFSKLNT